MTPELKAKLDNVIDECTRREYYSGFSKSYQYGTLLEDARSTARYCLSQDKEIQDLNKQAKELFTKLENKVGENLTLQSENARLTATLNNQTTLNGKLLGEVSALEQHNLALEAECDFCPEVKAKKEENALLEEKISRIEKDRHYYWQRALTLANEKIAIQKEIDEFKRNYSIPVESPLMKDNQDLCEKCEKIEKYKELDAKKEKTIRIISREYAELEHEIESLREDNEALSNALVEEDSLAESLLETLLDLTEDVVSFIRKDDLQSRKNLIASTGTSLELLDDIYDEVGDPDTD